MSKNKHCGNCARFFNEDAKGNGFCSISPNRQVVTCRHNTCIAHEWKLPKWTEITPDNVDLVDCIPNDKVVIGWICNDEFRSCSLSCFWFTLKHIAHQGCFYYYVLPELKIDNEQAGTNQTI